MSEAENSILRGKEGWVTDWLREIAPDAYGKAVIGRLESEFEDDICGKSDTSAEGDVDAAEVQPEPGEIDPFHSTYSASDRSHW